LIFGWVQIPICSLICEKEDIEILLSAEIYRLPQAGRRGMPRLYVWSIVEPTIFETVGIPRSARDKNKSSFRRL
jgi:hypothetical protein